MDLLTTLNENQKEAVLIKDGPCLVIAGAGSGKTKVLTTRIAYLINSGIYSSHILAITFTNKAAKEMKERLNNICENNYAFLGTFHSFGLRLIKDNYNLLGLNNNLLLYAVADLVDVDALIMRYDVILEKWTHNGGIFSKYLNKDAMSKLGYNLT